MPSPPSERGRIDGRTVALRLEAWIGLARLLSVTCFVRYSLPSFVSVSRLCRVSPDHLITLRSRPRPCVFHPLRTAPARRAPSHRPLYLTTAEQIRDAAMSQPGASWVLAWEKGSTHTRPCARLLHSANLQEYAASYQALSTLINGNSLHATACQRETETATRPRLSDCVDAEINT